MDESQRHDIRQKATEQIRKKWTKPPDCPICGTANWLMGNTMDAILRDQLELPEAGFRSEVYSLTPLFCGNCGYALFFNSVQLELVEPSESDKTHEPIEKVKKVE